MEDDGKAGLAKSVKDMNFDELEEVCAELRAKIIVTVFKNGGHLASNLGVVELTVALHRVFDLEQDSLVWDVGHQGYAHKLLTDRWQRFDSLRQAEGISGFIKPQESKYDAFLVGHASTSISAGLGLAKAKELSGEAGFVVPIIGDGALTGGLAFEGLNNAGESAKNFIVVLNDNGMSISENKGAIARYLENFCGNYFYLSFKGKIAQILAKTPLVGKPLVKFARKLKKWLKRQIYSRNLFENLGFEYFGPVDGHNLKSLVCMLTRAKSCQGPVLVHVRTKKGKGHEEAEQKPEEFHAVAGLGSGQKTFSSNFGAAVLRLAQSNKKICAITAAMKNSVGLADFAAQLPERFFDVGIAEEHAITFAAGLAVKGYVPVVAIHSTFLQRGLDQLLHDVACQGCHVVLAVDRAGFVGADGETHQGLFDVAFLSEIPGVQIYSPASFREQEECLGLAVAGRGLCVVRYFKGPEDAKVGELFEPGAEFLWLQEPREDVLLLTYGRLFGHLLGLPERFKKLGIGVSLLKLTKLHPIPQKALEAASNYKTVIFLEEGIEVGSIAQQFGARLCQMGSKANYFIRAVQGQFVGQGTIKEQYAQVGLDLPAIEKLVKVASLISIKRGSKAERHRPQGEPEEGEN